ncbi:MAG: hypothetical protein BWZ08_01715 [candidate division BRC1 bacterium ADurb.BinA292]|nr:MAG: hypothetical protein BWZ08_01715 [candidate division BRC1 bacterium ADurb.BinA292]
MIIDNKLAMQKGVSIGKAVENLNILIGSTYEQGFIRFGRFFKVYAQAAPEAILLKAVRKEAGALEPGAGLRHRGSLASERESDSHTPCSQAAGIL